MKESNEDVKDLSEEIFAGGHVEIVDLESLQIDETYQRKLMMHHTKIVREFDARACDPLKVGRRSDGTLWVIDGQQRRAALLKKGYKQWRAIVIASSGSQMEAFLFQIFGGGRGTVKAINMFDMFRAQLSAKDPIACSIRDTCVKNGFKVASVKSNSRYPYVKCLSQVYALVRVNGIDVLDESLKIIAESWPEHEYSTSAFVVLGMAQFLLYFPEADKERLVKMMQGTSLLHIHQSCLQMVNLRRGGYAPRFVAEYVMGKYNKGKKHRLTMPESKYAIAAVSDN